MGRARAGDVAAYETRVRRYQDIALRTASLVAPEADAADAVQDAFVKAYAALPRFRAGAPVRPWLLSIVINEGRNRRRSATRRADLAVRSVRPRRPPKPCFACLAGPSCDRVHAGVLRLKYEARSPHAPASSPAEFRLNGSSAH